MLPFPPPPRPQNLNTKIGVLGSGFIVSDCHLPSYRKAGFNVAAIASRNHDNAAKVASAHGINTVCPTFEALLADPSLQVASHLLESGQLGAPVFATIDMRGIPHWQPWQADTGSASLRIMSIHHFDCMRHWFGSPDRVYCSTRADPRTEFPHSDGICTTIFEYDDTGMRAVVVDDVWTGPAREGCPADIRIEWRIEGLDGLAIGNIGWCQDPYTTPSTVRFACKGDTDFTVPELTESWFPDAFAHTMGQLLVALENNEQPAIDARDNLATLALVEAAVLSAAEHRAVDPASISA